MRNTAAIRLLLASVISAVSVACGGAGDTAPARRLTVAVLWFENATGDETASHWRYTASRVLSEQLREVKAIRTLRSGAIGFAFRRVPTKGGVTGEQARAMGELIEAQRVVWGSYRREGGRWQLTARLLQVADGTASPDLVAASDDLFGTCLGLSDQILKQLGLAPSAEERRRMARPWTASATALEHGSRAYALRQGKRPPAECEALLRKAVAADSRFVEALWGLAAMTGEQGKHDEAEQAIKTALALRPDASASHRIHGVLLVMRLRVDEGKQALYEARRRDYDDPETLLCLGKILAMQKLLNAATTALTEAARLDRTDAEIHARLAAVHVMRRDRARALAALREAERLADPDDVDVAQSIGYAYDRLGDVPAAVKHLAKAVRLARPMGYAPKLVDMIEARVTLLRARLAPAYVEAAMPRTYSAQELDAALRSRLSREEARLVENPLASSPALSRWAGEIVEGREGEMEKARALFDALASRLQSGQSAGARTAAEVLAAWGTRGETFSCQELAKLFVVLARAIGLKAFMVHVNLDDRGRVVHHDCAALFVGGKALLVDVVYHWFGVPHKEVVVFDDVQAVAHHVAQQDVPSERLRRARLAVKLHPGFLEAHDHLVSLLADGGDWAAARRAFAAAATLAPGHWRVKTFEAFFLAEDGKLDEAAALLQAVVAEQPDWWRAHYGLGQLRGRQDKIDEAREHFRACLRRRPPDGAARKCRRAIAHINEQIGDE